MRGNALLSNGALLFLLCVGGSLNWMVATSGASEGLPVPGERTSLGSLSGSLVVSGSPVEAEQLKAQEEVRLASPEAVRAREESQTKYAGLGPGVAEYADGKVFPALVDEAGGGPRLASGERIAGLPSDFAVSVSGGSGGREVREGAEPIAMQDADGVRVPIDLALSDRGSAFAPVAGLAPVLISKRLSGGASLSDAGVSLTPVDESGVPLPGEGVVDGATVFYADTELASGGVSDVDTIVKPLTFGLELQTILRSDHAPSRLYFKVGLPAGAMLVPDASGSVNVVSGQAKLAVIFPPSAQDAQGVVVPTSLSLEGDTLVVAVDHAAGAYAYPIVVDPRYEYYANEFTWDTQVDNNGAHETNWHFEHTGSLFTGSEAEGGQGWTIHVSGSHGEHELGDMVYTTKGESHIWDFASETAQREKGTRVETLVKLEGSAGVEEDQPTPTEVGEPRWNDAQYCRLEEKCVTGVTPQMNNSAVYESVASGAGTGVAGENVFRKAEVAIQQPGNPVVKFDTADETVEGHPNALYGTKTWLGPYSGALVKISPSDKGIGVEGWSTEHTNSSGAWEALSEKSLMAEDLCDGIQCPSGAVTYVGYSSALPDGEPKLGADAWNALDESHAKETEPEAERRVTVRVDSTPPHGIVLKGLPAEGTVTTGEYHLTAEASDGSGTTRSSGVKSIAFFVDGKPLGTSSGSCSPGPCTATSNPVVLNTEEYAAGEHVLTIKATDNAENAISSETTFTVQPAATATVGPGSVNLLSGSYTLETSDVAMGSGLSVARSYGSRTPATGSGTVGPFGPQWSFTLGGQESIVPLPNENVVLAGASGARLIFVDNKRGGFESPATDRNLTLTFEEPGGVKEYLLKNTAANTSTAFREPSGGSGEVWMPSIQTGPVATDTITYSYETTTVEGQSVTRPIQALAPVPAGVSCSPKLERGCRALIFKYAEETTAKAGESESAWGLYKGRLKEVKFAAYDPTSKEMKEPTVADYLYDKQGRLRAEWNPLVSPALKLKYGYDAEGHVTAVTPPGQETWAFTYGTTESDPATGRLLRVTRAPASAPLWNGETLKDTELPKLSGSPSVGARMAVTNGTWTNSPIVYGYQWDRCNVEGKECASIPGATNPNYTPSAADELHTLVVAVTATNGGGSVTASSAASGVIVAKAGSYLQMVDSGHSLNAVSCISSTTTCVLSDSVGNALYATNVSSSSGGAWSSWSGPGGSPSEAIDCAASSLCLIAAGEKGGYGGGLYYATSLGGAWSLAYSPTYGVDAISCVSTSFCADGQDGAGYFRWSTSPASISWGLQEQGGAPMKAVSCLSASFCAISDAVGDVYVATTESQVKSSAWTQTDVDGSTALNGIACLSTSLCVAVDNTGNELTLKIESGGSASATKHNIDGTTSLTGVACPSSSTCVAVDSTGHVFVSTNSGETWTSLYALKDDLTAVSCASASLCTATDTSGKVAAFNLSGTGSEGEALSPQPGSTIEYNLPISGSGAPYEMGNKEVEAWGQKKDDPAYATAVFPPSEPQGWPASGHKGATIDYLDSHGRLVNTANPSEGITTSEYNEQNDVTRTLSVDNRATALKEGAKSAEAAERLDTQSTYNSEGTELQSTLGPRHLVKLPNGKEVQARNHTIYSYDEGAPSEGGPYRLVTKVVQEAQTETEGEQDPRTTITSYSGQTNLGWKLRKPTSVTGDPYGLKITHSTTYDEKTGNVVETQTPAANGEASTDLKSFFSFGGSGSGSGQLEKPAGVAVDSSGNVWVADTGHDRVQEFNSKGEFVREFGAEGSGNGEFSGLHGIAVSSTGNVYVADDGNHRVQEFNSKGEFVRVFGSKGTGNGQFEGLRNIAVDSEGRVWTVEEGIEGIAGKDRVQEFTAEGVYLGQFGKEGTGNGQFKSPEGIAVSNGYVWVTDTGNNRVEVFKPSGEFIRAFGAEGTGNGQFKKPTGVAIDPEGDAWISDSGNNRVQRFTGEGGYLSQVGTIGNENGQFNKPGGIATDSSGNVWVADSGNNRVQELTGSEFVRKFGGSGSGSGQLEKPAGVAVDSSGNVWVADTGHDRVQEFNSEGEFVRQFGAEGSGNGEFSGLRGIAVSATGNVYVADDGNHRVQEFNSKGEFIRAFGSKGTGNGQFEGLRNIAVDGEGHVWTVEVGIESIAGKDRVQEFTAEGVYLGQFGKEGTGNGQFRSPEGIAIDSKGYVWVTDTGNNRVEVFKPSGEFIRAFGAEGTGNGQFKKPTGVTIDSEGNAWVSDSGNNRVQRFTGEGSYLSQVGTAGNENGQFNKPEGIATDSSGNVWVADSGNNRVQELTGSEFVRKFGGSGSGSGQLEKPGGVAVDSSGNVWVADTGHDRVQEFNSKGEFVRQFGAQGSGNGEFSSPHGIAMSSTGNVYVADDGNHRVQEFNSKGEFIRVFGSKGTGNGQFEELRGIAVDGEGHVWTVEVGVEGLIGKDRVQEFTAGGVYLGQFGKEGTGNGQFKSPEGITIDSKGYVWVTDTGNNRVEVFKPTGEFIRAFGAEGTGNGQFKKPAGVAIDPEGDVWVSDSGNNRVQRFTGEGSYLSQVGTIGNENGQFNKPEGIATNGSGNILVADAGNRRIEVWTPEHRFAHDTKTAYYTPGAESPVEACRNHREWANLPCRTEPAAQPLDASQGQPTLPIVTTTYNMYDQPAETKSMVMECFKVSPGTGKYTNSTCTSSGSGEYELKTNTRTTTMTYDEAGRPKSSEISSTVGKSMPAVTDKYSESTGAPTEQATSTESIKTAYNTLGQMTSYTDASGKTTTYEYEGEGKYTGGKELDGRPRAVNDGQGTETYAYNETTGTLSELTIAGAGTFTANYDAEGNMLSEHYPNGMSAAYTYNQTDQPTSLVYDKETHCTEGCEWFKDTAVPSIHDQWASQTSSLGTDSYGYDAVGRLTETTQTPAGKGCVTRRYAYDEDTNRTSLTTFSPNSKNECSTTSGNTEEKHSYDEADRLTDTGTAYEPFGETTKLAASDAGGSELLSTFYTDGQLHEQKQGAGANEQTIGYTLDPAGRTESVVSTGKVVATETLHYTGPANTPAWTSEPSGNTTRMIGAMSGLVAIQHGTETPTLQLSNLHGDIVETAEDSETASKPASTIAEPTEYGVPATEAPPKYSWLGAHELPTELPSGVMAMGARSYVPTLGRFLQTDPIAGGSTNPYAYTNGDPVNETDLTGGYVENEYVLTLGAEQNGLAIEAEAAREAAIRAEEERKAREAAIQAMFAARAAAELAEAEARNAWNAAAAAGPQGAGEEWEWYEEEGEYEWEYASYHNDDNAEQAPGHTEEVLLYQPLGETPAGAEPQEHGQAGHYRNVSGDGCGDGGYCKGHWVKKSGKGHRRGEPIGAKKDPGGALGCTAIAGVMVASGVDAWMGVGVGFGCAMATL